jgi:2-dehydropantoate 2-reductase
MKISVVGIGAVGGALASNWGQTDVELSLLEREPFISAIREKGLRMIDPEGECVETRPHCVGNANDLPTQDFVFICVKTYDIPDVTKTVLPLLGKRTRVIFVQNGIPWWYFHGLEGPWKDATIDCLDPESSIRKAIEPWRVIGCVTYVASRVIEPGTVEQTGDNRFDFGEPTGVVSEDCRHIVDLLGKTGVDARISERIRDDIWLKLWGNLSLNPLSVLTGATFDRMCGDPSMRLVILKMMTEAQMIAERLGAHFATGMEERLREAEKLKGFKSSMLQDLEAGRRLEIDAIIGVVSEMGRMTKLPTPIIDAVLALVRLRAQVSGCL